MDKISFVKITCPHCMKSFEAEMKVVIIETSSSH